MGEARVRAEAGLTERSSAAPPKWLAFADRLFAIDLRSLGLFRILVAVLVLIDLVGRSTDLAAHYTDTGILPRAALLAYDPGNWSPYFSVHMLTGTALGEAALFLLAALWGIALLVGYRTTLSTIATWYLLSSVQLRNPFIQNSADDLLRMLLFWSMFLPLGARFSLDARQKAKREPNQSAEPIRFLSMATVALLLQVGFLYWFAAASKSDPAWHQDGMAIYYTLSIGLYATPFGQFLLNFPQLMQLMTRATLWLEALGPALAFSPVATPFVRSIVVVMFFIFHLVCLNACLDLGAFHYVSAVAWVPFLPTLLWDRLEKRFGRQNKTTSAETRSGLPTVQSARLAENEWSAGPAVKAELQKRRRSPWTPIVLNTVVGFFLIYVFLWNFRALNQRYAMPKPWRRVAQVTHVDQGWGMFAPKPFTEPGWYVFPGKLKNGKDVDLFLGDSTIGKPINWEKPQVLISSLFKNERWRRYQMNLWARAYSDQRPHYCRYLCREWNRTHTGGEQLASFKLYYMLEETLPNYIQSDPRPVLLIEWKCDDTEDGGSGKPSKSAGDQDASGRANFHDLRKQP
jgi:hypothetical protein